MSALTLSMSTALARQIDAHGEATYPHECCGLLMGRETGDGARTVLALVPLDNTREVEERYHRFLIAPADMLRAELEAQAQNLDMIGVYHSHPDHPAEPSSFDREHALPWWSYVITSVRAGRAAQSRAWRLADDRQSYTEEQLVYLDQASTDEEIEETHE